MKQAEPCTGTCRKHTEKGGAKLRNMDRTHRNRESPAQGHREDTHKQGEFSTGTERTHRNRECSAERLGENTQKEGELCTGTCRKYTETGGPKHRNMNRTHRNR